MKISFMLKREDFYKINRDTLEKYYQNSRTEKRLYIYPELNAIVTARPSKTVRQYLYTEFRVNGSPIKRLLVRLYAMVMLNSGGLFAAKSLKMKTDADKDTLIYPCNKKYRVFDFKNNQVSVFVKVGFPGESLANEIAFRVENRADFIPGLLYSDETSYTETIIDGCPVARTGQQMTALSDRAFAVWSDYILPYTKQIPAPEYAAMSQKRVEQLKNTVQEMGKTIDVPALETWCTKLLRAMQAETDFVPVSLSHGDLQPGNIWVENKTGKLYIIDWESWEERSTWYDRALLYENLRRTDGIIQYAKQKDLVHVTVLLEDLIFRLTELTNLPYNYGCTEFNNSIKELGGENSDV